MRRNVVEWTALLVSVAGIAVLVGVLVVAALGETRPADPRVELHMAEAFAGQLGWIVPATLSNGGDEAIEAVVLEAGATVGSAAEASELEIDFLPAGTSVEVAFAFSAEPDGAVEVRLVGYRRP